MSASYQAEDTLVLAQQLRVQDVCLTANNTLLTVSGSDLKLQLNEPISSVLMVVKQVALGTISGVVPTIGADGTSIILTGESAAVASTAYLIKYIATFP